MDPLSITTSATAILAICMQSVHLIQRTIETVKNSRKLLVKLLSQTERLRLSLEQLRSLTKQLGTRGGILLSYNDSAPKLTINELNNLVLEIAGRPSYLGIQTLLHKSKVDVLIERLKKHEEEIVTVLLLIATESAVRTEDEVLQIHKESELQSKVLTLFEDYFLVNPSSSSSHFKPSKSLQIWFGDTSRDGFNEEYLAMRDRLSDAAFNGDFDTVFEVLKAAEEKYGESWINAPRLSHDPSRSSGWTPLHQAAFMSSSKATVDRLLDLGALRTIRTSWTDPNELPYVDMTAGEIARHLGSSYLYEILSPGVRNSVPHTILRTLQEQLHKMILRDLDSGGAYEDLRLPDLSPLTELDVPEMWFPFKAPDSADQNWLRGYLYRLDGRELRIKAFGIRDSEDSRLYRISIDGTREIVDGVTFDTAANKQ